MITIRTRNNDSAKPDGASSKLLTRCMLAAFEATMGEKLETAYVDWRISEGPDFRAATGAVFPTNSDGTFRAEADLTQMQDGTFRLDLVEVRRDPDLLDEQGLRGIWLPSPVNLLALRPTEPEHDTDPELGTLLSDAEALVAGLAAKPRTIASSDKLKALETAIREMCDRSCAEAMHASDSGTVQFAYGGRLHVAEPDQDGTLMISSSDGRHRSFGDSDTGLCLAALRSALLEAEAQ